VKKLFSGFFVTLACLSIKFPLFAYPEYAAYAGSNCNACHVGPVGGFGRKPLSTTDPGWITDKFSMSGDFLFMGLYDQRPKKDRVVLFPMEASIHFAYSLKETITMTASMDYDTLREAYAMVHNENQTAYVRAGFFTLPYGILFGDHTSFVKEGRVETGTRTFEEKGIGAGLFGVRYKDSGIEAGLSGRPWFLNVAMTAGVVGQESRSLPSNQAGTKRAITRRAGFITKNVCLGGSMYTNDNEVLDRRILRYGGFGWFHVGSFALLFEHDEGEEERFNVSGSTQLTASYVELVYAFPFPQKSPSYAKVRYERLDTNRSVDGDLLQRWVFSYRFNPTDYMSLETFYRNNLEQTNSTSNDDIFIISHFFF
jgi:hypothetical protein